MVVEEDQDLLKHLVLLVKVAAEVVVEGINHQQMVVLHLPVQNYLLVKQELIDLMV